MINSFPKDAVSTAAALTLLLALNPAQATEGGVSLYPGMGARAKVIKTDIKADNGYIHVIDSVLIPPSIQKAMMAKKPMKASKMGGKMSGKM